MVLTAHLDHIGLRPSGDGDRINNGAYDNATGSAILLEVARVLGAQPVRPKRSVVIVLVTAEEKGLLGSDYFAHYPVEAAGRMVANVNLDMPLFLTASTDVVAFGAENSTLDGVVRKAAADAGYTLSPDPMPEENIFVRSDQYSLVKQGVPAVALMPGLTAKDPAVKGPQVLEGFLASHYHKPSDDLSLPMDLQAVERFTRANLAVVRAIADDPVDPAWKPGQLLREDVRGAEVRRCDTRLNLRHNARHTTDTAGALGRARPPAVRVGLPEPDAPRGGRRRRDIPSQGTDITMTHLFPHPLPWYVAGPLIGLMVPALLLLGNKPFGISSNLRHLCAAFAPCGIEFFGHDWRRLGLWNLDVPAGYLRRSGGRVVARAAACRDRFVLTRCRRSISSACTT